MGKLAAHVLIQGQSEERINPLSSAPSLVLSQEQARSCLKLLTPRVEAPGKVHGSIRFTLI
jgi:hypothetical protein